MRRWHLFEIHEQPWCPAVLRRTATDHLRGVLDATRVYAPLAPVLARALHETGDRRIVDLCSGGSGPLGHVVDQLVAEHGLDVEVAMTDLFPNVPAFAAVAATSRRFTWCAEPVDARSVPAHLDGFRTMFGAFHHFRPEDARAILADAAARRAPIAVFEVTSRRPWCLAAMLAVPLLALVVTPFLRPFSLARVFWTYILPVAPAILLFDGWVSSLRSYTEDELREMTAELCDEDYAFEVGTIPSRGMSVTWLVGRRTMAEAA